MIACDNCKDLLMDYVTISITQDISDITLDLSTMSITNIADFPLCGIDRPYHFCDVGCLEGWIEERFHKKSK